MENNKFKNDLDFLAKINYFVQLINSNTKDKKNIIVFDEMDRCSNEDQLAFINILKNVFFD